MNSLEPQIIGNIEKTGAMRLDHFMQSCLFDPEHGYYTQEQVFGQGGDFVTAPEISQMFGEMVGLAVAQYWQDMGQPEAFSLCELGPGRGTMMADMLRVISGVPKLLEAAEIFLMEASPKRQDQQREQLKGYDVQWFQDIEHLPQKPLLCVANEFFDALPIRQFKRTQEGWRECYVGILGAKLHFVWQSVDALEVLDDRIADTKIGDIIEICAAARQMAAQIGAHIEKHGGMALIIDYGDWRSQGDTLQAVRQHKASSVLAHLGQSDLTAHVDFEALAGAAPCLHTRLCTQGVFLERLGITTRAQKLAEKLENQALEMHISAHRRLTHPDEMGSLFKVLGLYQNAKAVPVGLQYD